MATIKPANSAVAPFAITNSLQFDVADSAHLTFTPDDAGNQRVWTFSGWVKVFNTSSNKTIFMGGTHPTAPYGKVGSEGTFTIRVNYIIGSTGYFYVDGDLAHSEWHHIVWAVDTTDSTQNNRSRLYVNGSEITTWAADNKLAINLDTGVNAAHEHQIGEMAGVGNYWNGLMAEMHLVDGTQLTPAAFAEDEDGTWTAIEYEGSYGTNGWHLDFKDNSDIGADVSGNGNDWAPQNLASGDVKTDVPPYVGD